MIIYRNIKIGDDLSGKTLYFNFPDNLYTKIRGDMIGTEFPIIETSTNSVYEYKTVSTRFNTFGVACSGFSGTSGVCYLHYSNSSWGTDISLTSITLPDNFGVVTNVYPFIPGEVVDYGSQVYEYIKVGIEKPDLVNTIQEYYNTYDENYERICNRNVIHPKFKIQILDMGENIIDEITGDISTDNARLCFE